MEQRSGFCAVTLLVLALSACSGGETHGTSGAGGSSPGVAPATLSGTVLDLTTFLAVAGADVCALGTKDCAKTDGDGVFSLSTPARDDLAVDVTAAGMAHTIVPAPAGGGDALLVVSLFPQAVVDGPVASSLGVTLDPTKGMLLVLKSEDGASASLTSGTGPFYVSNGAADPAATATFGTGTVAFANVDPGEQELTFTHPTLGCHPPAWSGASPGSSRLPLVAGAITSIGFVPCY